MENKFIKRKIRLAWVNLLILNFSQLFYYDKIFLKACNRII